MNCSMQDSMDTPRGRLTKGSGVGAWPLALALLCLTGCPEGLDRPAPTALKLITGGTFKLGPPRLDKAGNPSKTGKIPLKCGGKDSIPTDRCDSGDTHDPLLWIDKLTWVPNATAHVKTFKIERHEVTNLQYRYCVEKGACDEPDLKQVGGVEYYGASEYDDHPVVYVSREDAQRYCAFIGRKLPTEAQWERAARLEKSLKVVRTYPYESHSEPDCSKNNKRRIVSQGCSQIPPSGRGLRRRRDGSGRDGHGLQRLRVGPGRLEPLLLLQGQDHGLRPDLASTQRLVHKKDQGAEVLRSRQQVEVPAVVPA